MRLLLFLLMLSASVSGQNLIQVELDSDSIRIHDIENPGAGWYQIIIQNTDSYWEAVTYWSQEPEGVYYTPYCNFTVKRQAFLGWQFLQSNSVEIDKSNVQIKVWTGKYITPFKINGDFDSIQMECFSLGGTQLRFQLGSSLFAYQHSITNAGSYMAVIEPYGPYVNHPVMIRFLIENGSCSHLITRLIYI